MNRYQAFAIHLAISIAVLLVLLGIIFFVWYPFDFIKAGGLNGLKILASVDLVLGPLLTLIVYNPVKKSLKFDLSVIAILQVSCMAVGLWLVFNERPLVQLLSHNGVELINAADYQSNDIKFSELEIKGKKPLWLALDIKTDNEGQVFMDQFVGDFISGKPFTQRFEKYIQMDEFGLEAFESRVEYIKSVLSDNQKQDIAEFTKTSANKECSWLPVNSTHLSYAYACTNYQQGVIKIETLSKNTTSIRSPN